jgi:predicted AAA+ superfamily ATPase
MLLKSEIEACFISQAEIIRLTDSGLQRKLIANIDLKKEFITIITGIRRCGKSTLMQQLMEKVPGEVAYMNFEDPRIFGFDLHDFEKLNEIIGDRQFYFFDEIQNVERWELYIRKLHDLKKVICITGSNASLLSKELGTRLTGRNITKELFPFNFQEFCSFLNREKNIESFEQFLESGGFPSYLISMEIDYLQQLFKDIINRDIIVRYGIRNAKILEELTLYLISNIGKEYSLNSIKNNFKIGSANSVADYISWFEDSYLLFSLPKFSWSLKSISVNPKKIYCIDNGLINANSLSFSADKGRLLENAVYIQLRRNHKEIYYFRENGECDFIVKDRNKVTKLIQVCYELNADNMKRETNGLLEAMDYFNLDEGLIITLQQEDKLQFENKIINVMKAHQWF